MTMIRNFFGRRRQPGTVKDCVVAVTLILFPIDSHAVAQVHRVADPASFIRINCGKAGAHDRKQEMDQYFLKRNIATLNLAKELSLGWARCGSGLEQWYVGGKPSPERFDIVFDHANTLGIRIYLYIEYRGDVNKERITDFDWLETGRAFASHFGKRVASTK